MNEDLVVVGTLATDWKGDLLREVSDLEVVAGVDLPAHHNVFVLDQRNFDIELVLLVDIDSLQILIRSLLQDCQMLAPSLPPDSICRR